MRLTGVSKAAMLLSIVGVGISAGARAADMAPLYTPSPSFAEPDQPLEFGSGWYLRGDAAYSDEDHPKLNTTLGSFDRAATSSGYAFGVGVGYKMNSFLRFDVTADYLDPYSYTDQVPCGTGCAAALKTQVSRFDGLANGYVDLGTWSGFTPYVGAGVGVGGTYQDSSVTLAGAAPSVAPFTATGSPNKSSHSDYQFAWAAMAGVSYAVSPHTVIDVGYRYLDLGRTTIALQPVSSTQKDITAQQVRVGVRYTID